MPGFPSILAETENDITKVIFGVVFFLIWAASAAMSAIAKKKEKERRERVRGSLQTPGSMPPPLPQQAGKPDHQESAPRQRQQPRPAPPRAPARMQPPQKRFPVKSPRPARILLQTPAVPETPEPATRNAPAPVEATEISRQPPAQLVKRRVSATISADALHAWLRPQTLHEQFMLTEVLQPPIALRERQLWD